MTYGATKKAIQIAPMSSQIYLGILQGELATKYNSLGIDHFKDMDSTHKV